MLDVTLHCISYPAPLRQVIWSSMMRRDGRMNKPSNEKNTSIFRYLKDGLVRVWRGVASKLSKNVILGDPFSRDTCSVDPDLGGHEEVD